MRLEIVAHHRAGIVGELRNVGADVILFVNGIEDVGDARLDAFRRDAVGLVPRHLLLAAAAGLGHRPLHRAGDVVGIENDLAVNVARGPADRLDQRGLGTQEAFLVGVEDGDEPAFGNVEAFAQQVDADQHVERAEAQVAQNLDALQRVDVGVHVADANAALMQIFRQVFGHALGQHGDQRAISFAGRLAGSRRPHRRPGSWPGGPQPAGRSGRSGG